MFAQVQAGAESRPLPLAGSRPAPSAQEAGKDSCKLCAQPRSRWRRAGRAGRPRSRAGDQCGPLSAAHSQGTSSEPRLTAAPCISRLESRLGSWGWPGAAPPFPPGQESRGTPPAPSDRRTGKASWKLCGPAGLELRGGWGRWFASDSVWSESLGCTSASVKKALSFPGLRAAFPSEPEQGLRGLHITEHRFQPERPETHPEHPGATKPSQQPHRQGSWTQSTACGFPCWQTREVSARSDLTWVPRLTASIILNSERLRASPLRAGTRQAYSSHSYST